VFVADRFVTIGFPMPQSHPDNFHAWTHTDIVLADRPLPQKEASETLIHRDNRPFD
jgi:hypothetical protein